MGVVVGVAVSHGSVAVGVGLRRAVFFDERQRHNLTDGHGIHGGGGSSLRLLEQATLRGVLDPADGFVFQPIGLRFVAAGIETGSGANAVEDGLNRFVGNVDVDLHI